MVLRVILLKRISQLGRGCFETDKNLAEQDAIKGPWIVLGHFDAMYSWRPSIINGFFDTIRHCSETVASLNSGTTYYHPLYLLDTSEETDAEQQYWENNDWFISVVRIHFSKIIYNKSLVDTLFTDIQSQATALGCQIRIYHTMELSDIVAIVRSPRMDNLLRFSLSMQKHPSVGKEYTYVGVSYEQLCAAHMPEADDQIPVLSMRFSVSDYQKASSLLAEIINSVGTDMPAYAITGVDDIAVNWPAFPLHQLIDLYRNWFWPAHLFPKPPSIALHEAFWEVTSRVGVSIDTLPEFSIPTPLPEEKSPEEKPPEEKPPEKKSSEEKSPKEKSPEEILRDVATELSSQWCQLKDTAIVKDACWYQPLGELTKALIRMCQTPVLDEFVFLLLPSALAFLNNLKAKSDLSPSNSDTDKYNMYLEKWSQLMEHVMRLEGQLTQYPDTRPIIYNIPVVMLEYMTALAHKITSILQDGQNAIQRFFLVPQLGYEVKSKEIFSAEQAQGLVLVTLPLRTLYDPVAVQMALCHEICHFVGEKYRKRTYRSECIAHSVAIIMAKILFQTYHPSLVEELKAKINSLFSSTQPTYIRNMQTAVGTWVDSLFVENSPEYAELMFKVVERISTSNGPPLQLKEGINDAHLFIFIQVLRDILILYREVYADICMMFLLDGCAQTYFESIAEVLNNDSTTENIPAHPIYTLSQQDAAEDLDKHNYFEPLAVRVYATLTALGEANNLHAGNSYACNQLYDSITALIRQAQGTREPDRVIPLGSIHALVAYATECYKNLQVSLANSAELHNFKTLLQKVPSTGLNYDTLMRAIQEDRKSIIDELKQIIPSKTT